MRFWKEAMRFRTTVKPLHTLEALPVVINKLREQRYTFITTSEMLQKYNSIR